MPRYERHDEHGDRFCSLRAVGDVCVVRKGAIGSYGRASLEPCRDEARARARVVEIGEQLCTQGYAEVSELELGAHDQPFDPELKRTLEAALRDDSQQREAWAVYADMLAAFMPELGQRIVLELAREGSEPEQARALTTRIRELDRRYRRRWAGRELAALLSKKGKTPPGLELNWRYGFIDGARLSYTQLRRVRSGPIAAYEALLDSPAARLLARLDVQLDTQDWWRDERYLQLLERLSRPDPRLSLRRLSLGCSGPHPVELGALLRAHPQLRQLQVAGKLALTQAATHEQLQRLGMSTRASGIELSAGFESLQLPELRALQLALDREEASAFRWARALLHGALLPMSQLDELALKQRNRAEPWLRVLLESPLLPQLRVLELDFGFDGHALGLLASDYRRLNRLERLVIPRRCFMGVNPEVLRDKLPRLELP